MASNLHTPLVGLLRVLSTTVGQGGTRGGEAKLGQHHHTVVAGNLHHGNFREEIHNTDSVLRFEM